MFQKDLMMKGDTIAAISTPRGHGGIGVVRLSGMESLRIAEEIFHPKGDSVKPRVATLGDIEDHARGVMLDRCLLTFFPGPNSYTGEDVVEFSCHGSMPVLARVMQILVDRGARPSGRGEFTLRAVLNGRMDLTQAEAVNRLVRARTLLQAERAVSHLEGSISRRVKRIDEMLLDAVARMAASVDFADEDEEFISPHEAAECVERIVKELDDLISGFGRADILREGAVVVIAGVANAGKSTLFNAILKRERSIVDERPGTTRDYITETVDLGGLPVTLVDTAGLRSTEGDIEIKGMRRTEERLGEADLVLLVTECGRSLNSEERSILAGLKKHEKAVLVVCNKCDLSEPTGECDSALTISALNGEGVDGLLKTVSEIICGNGLDSAASDELITELRQQQLFKLTNEAVGRAATLLEQVAYEELVLEELNSAMRALGEITGGKAIDDVLERIFSNFCIGK